MITTEASNAFIFFAMSICEYIPIIYLMWSVYNFKAFNFSRKQHITMIVLTCIILTFTSFYMRDGGGFVAPGLAPATQMIMYWIFIYLVYRLNFYHTLAVGTLSYLGYSFVQAVIFILLRITHVLKPEDQLVGTLKGCILGVSTVITVMFIGFLLNRYNKHINLSLTTKTRIKVSKINIMLLVLIIITITTFSICFILVVLGSMSSSWVTILVIIVGVLVMAMYYASIKKDIVKQVEKQKGIQEMMEEMDD